MDDIDHDKVLAALEQLEGERARRIAEKVEAGEAVVVRLSVAVATESEIPDAVEQAKARKLKELRAAGEVRAVQFDVMAVATGVCRLGGGEEWTPEPRPHVPPLPPQDEDKEEAREEPRPPIVASYVCVQTRPCRDNDDPGQIMEGWFSVDDGTVTVTDREGRHITSRAMIAGEDPAALARLLLREARAPEDFNRRLDYPKLGTA
jgi:hypothetical protein